MVCYHFYACVLVFRFMVVCENCKEISTLSTSPLIVDVQSLDWLFNNGIYHT